MSEFNTGVDMFKVRGATIGDIHLGNTRNETKYIIANLYRYVTPDLFRNIDIFVVNGDLYDRDILLGSEDALMIAEFDKYLNDLAIKHNVYLYYLKGTFTHDYNQIKTLTLYNDSKLFKYIEKIDIVYNKELGLHIGFIPDDTGYSPIEIERILREKMDKYGIDTLDLLFIHGMFDYQLPIKLEHSFDVSQFSYVKYYIIINHIHKFSVMNNIIAPGSFDRMAFNEEESKGFVLFNLSGTGNKSFNFIENKHAMLFKTFDINDEDVHYWTTQIEKYINEHKPKHVRLIIRSNIDYTPIANMIKENDVNLKIERKDSEVIDTEIVVTYIPYQIDKNNIRENIEKRLPLTERHDKLLLDIL